MTTPNIGLVTLSNSQGQYLNANETFAIIDALLGKAVKDKDLNAPPGSPANGDVYIVGTSPTGLWSGKAKQIAFWSSDAGAWVFVQPKEGWKFEPTDEDVVYRYDGTNWVSYGGGFTGGTLSSALNEAPLVTLASAANVSIGAAAANTINITGTTAIIAFDIIPAGAVRRLVFQGILTLTHHATAQILPTGANITTAAGDVAEFVSLGSGNWRCTDYMRASGQALAGSIQSIPVACSNETTALIASSSLVTFHVPYAFALSEVMAELTVPQTSGAIFTVDINKAGVSILSTKLTIDNTEETSITAATPPVISDSNLARGAKITIDIDQIGDGTAKGLKIWLIGTRVG